MAATSGSDADLSPRRLLYEFILFSRAEKQPRDTSSTSAQFFRETCDPARLTTSLLDLRLNEDEAQRFRRSLGSINLNRQAAELPAGTGAQSLAVIDCYCCNAPKIFCSLDTNLSISEFPANLPQTSCCSRWVCIDCHVGHVRKSLCRMWPYISTPLNPGCPVLMCTSYQACDLNEAEDFARWRESVGLTHTADLDTLHQRANRLRETIRRFAPQPCDASIYHLAERIHTNLTINRVMKAIDDPSLEWPAEDGNITEVCFQPVLMTASDGEGSPSFEIPILKGLLRKKTTSEECAVCGDDIYEVDCGRRDSLEDFWFYSSYGGDWKSKIFSFPRQLRCDHPLDVCSDCLAQHISFQVSTYGRACCDNLGCPSEGCDRKLTFEEIQLYADPASFWLYDKYLTLNALSDQAGFRWCLGEGCSWGGIIDEDDVFEWHDCRECGTRMCFKHQVLWHFDLTCEEYDSLREHGDPQHSNTITWIDENTKPCPGCQSKIVKGNGCFHMTCSRCAAEFCWECLAIWGANRPHAATCYFTTSQIQPHQIMGQTLQAALAAHNG